jgi:Ca2+-binding EF-hand superfamily protein
MGVVVEEEDLEQFFNIYDANRSGTLDYKEFSDVVFGRSRP